MDLLRPAGREEALAAKAGHPAAVPVAGGTDVMVEIDFDHRRPGYLMDPNRVGDLYEGEAGEDVVRLGASVPYAQTVEHLRAAGLGDQGRHRRVRPPPGTSHHRDRVTPPPLRAVVSPPPARPQPRGAGHAGHRRGAGPVGRTGP
ncbi:FAD binding domain-containing protein [Streptomyces pimonensis]|uniref:FAD binding domain-containing protein n=1 Tax=Streptomyces pimonensis TaxID=2860288 RepID=A0ABV4J0S0_9ACTN